MEKVLPRVDVYADTTEKVLQHKLKDGLLSKDRYCYWTRKSQFSEVADLVHPRFSKNYIDSGIGYSIYQIIGYPKAWVWMIRQPEDKDYVDREFDVRLHIKINGREVGYFKCFGANLHFTELWFHSEHFIKISDIICPICKGIYSMDKNHSCKCNEVSGNSFQD